MPRKADPSVFRVSSHRYFGRSSDEFPGSVSRRHPFAGKFRIRRPAVRRKEFLTVHWVHLAPWHPRLFGVSRGTRRLGGRCPTAPPAIFLSKHARASPHGPSATPCVRAPTCRGPPVQPARGTLLPGAPSLHTQPLVTRRRCRVGHAAAPCSWPSETNASPLGKRALGRPSPEDDCAAVCCSCLCGDG